MSLDYLSTISIGEVLYVSIMTLLVYILLGVIFGNVLIMRLVALFGIPVYCGKIAKDYRLSKMVNKDTVAWLSIPNICYSPVLLGNYKRVNFLGKESKKGELYVSPNKSITSLSNLALPSDNVLKDLTVIQGSVGVSSLSLRDAKFTFLTKFIKSDLRNREPFILVYEERKLRKFQFLFSVNLRLEDNMGIQATSRSEFLKRMQDLASNKGILSFEDKQVLILSGSDGIDNLLMFIVEEG